MKIKFNLENRTKVRVQFKNESSYFREGKTMGVKMPKKSKPQRPTRDEFELEELGNTLVEACEEKTMVNLTVWKKGEVQQVLGTITKMDGQTKLIHVESGIEIIKIPFIDILQVASA